MTDPYETGQGGVEAATLASFITGPGAPGTEGSDRTWASTNALRAIRTHLGMEVAFISEFRDGMRLFRYVDAASPGQPVRAGESGPLEESYCQRVVDGRLPELIADARQVPAAAALPVTHDLPVGAHLSVPIRLRDGRVYGTFCCFSRRPDHSLNERDLAVMRVFADLTAAQIDRDLELEQRDTETRRRIAAAVAGEGLAMVFQPVVDIERRRPIGFEALARFAAPPQQGPDRWFAEAAAIGRGVDLELAAIRLALADAGALPADTYLALNVSPATVLSEELEATLRGMLPEQIVLEVTEHVAIETYEQLRAALAPLRARGVRLAVDDAGAGYASFRHILLLCPDIIKLDMTLTRAIDRDAPRRALAVALIAFATETGSDIVAEGVETAGELRVLQHLGVRVAQGYHLGRPEPASRLAARPAVSGCGTP